MNRNKLLLSSEVKSILHQHNLVYVFENQQIFSIKEIILKLKSSMRDNQQELLKTECQNV